jgi:hypothetical protein
VGISYNSQYLIHFLLSSSELNFVLFFLFVFAARRISMIEKLPGSDLYDSFAYDIMVLKYFVREGTGRKRSSKTSKRRASGSRVNPLFGKIRRGIDSSLHSVSGRIRASLDFSGHSSNSGRMRPSSMDGSNHSYGTKKTAKMTRDIGKGGSNSERARTSSFL